MSTVKNCLDTVGACASLLCMAHCLATPLILALLAGSAQFGGSTAAIVNAAPVAEPGTVPTGDHHDHAPEARSDETSSCATVCETEVEETSHTTCCSGTTDTIVHASFLGMALPLGLWAWVLGYKRHGHLGSVVVGGVGLVLLTAALLSTQLHSPWPVEQPLTVSGSLCILVAHWWNHRRRICCHGPQPESAQ